MTQPRLPVRQGVTALVEKGLRSLEQCEERDRAALVEATAKSVIDYVMEYRGTSLRLRRLLSANLAAAEDVVNEIPDAAILSGLLVDVDHNVRSAIYDAVSLPNRIEATAQLVQTFGKLLAIDKDLLGISMLQPPIQPVDEVHDGGLTVEDAARFERMAAKFRSLRAPHQDDVTDVESK